MKKTKFLLSLISALFINQAFATEFETKFINYKFNTQYKAENETNFPFVVSGNKTVDNRVNTMLHMSLLNTLPPKSINEKNTILKQVDASEISFEKPILINKKRVLGFNFNLESCGAYCENYDMNFYFDTRNGRLITEGEIFNLKTIPQLANIINKENNNTVKRFLKNIKKEAKKSGRTEVEIEEQILIYESCLEGRNNKDKDSYYKNYLGKVTMLDGVVNFTYERCSNHAMRALDDLWETTKTMQAEELRPYLSEYGKYIILGEGDGVVPEINNYAQLYQGKLNNKIDLVLYVGDLDRNQKKNSPYSSYNQEKYIYTKYKKAIELNLDANSSSKEYMLIENQENADSIDEKARFQFKVKNNKLIGNWISKDKTLSFEAEPLK
jgi:hypothetical protein